MKPEDAKRDRDAQQARKYLVECGLDDFTKDPHAAATRVLGMAVLGLLPQGTAESQRRAALDVLGDAMWEHLSDAQLKAHAQRVADELRRREAGK